jgi:cyclophilin family peptidyl-prolyl cis-trans isomerase
MTNKLSIGLLSVLLPFFILAACGQTSNNTETQTQKEGPAMVVLSTDFGDITIALYDETPGHRDNFMKLVRDGLYDGTVFHRVINGFMIQGGDLATRGPDYVQSDQVTVPESIPAEIIPGLFHKKGALAAARQGDNVNPERRSSGTQFYIVQGRVFSDEELDIMEQRTGTAFTAEQRQVYTSIGGTPHLDHAYTVFGEVTDGLHVVDSIAAVQTARADRPVNDVRMSVKEIK